MKKSSIVKFLQKLNLNDTIPSAILEIQDKSLFSVGKDMAGGLRCLVTLPEFDFPDMKIGSYSTATLIKMLSVLNDDLEMTAVNDSVKPDEVNSLVFIDSEKRKVTYAASPLTIINHDGKKNKITQWEAEFPLLQSISKDILRASSALNTESITFISKDESLYAILNYSQDNQDMIEIEIPGANVQEEFETISFPLSVVKNILAINDSDAIVTISNKGLLRILFDKDEIISEYWLTKLQ